MLSAAFVGVVLAVTSPSPAPSPGQVTVQDKRITESSGLVASPTHPGLVWTVNDSGSTAVVYGVSARTGRTLATLRLADTQARDWEAMTATRDGEGRGLLWIGDVGDNRAVRDSVVLRLVREPLQVSSQTLTPVSLRVRYPDGAHDVETLIWTPDGRLLLVSKDLFSGIVYQVPPPAVAAALAGRSTLDPVVAVPLAQVAMSLVTDGAALPDGRIILRGYSQARIYPDPVVGGTLEPQQQVPLPAQPQGETLAVMDGGAAVLVGSEGVRQPLYRVALPAPSPTGSPSTAPSPRGTSSPAEAPSPSPSSSPAAAAPTRAGSDPAPLLAIGAAALALVAIAGLRRRARRRRGSG